MAAALVDAGIRADLIVGASIGAINGALLAASPGLDGVERLRVLWQGVAGRGLLSERMVDRVRTRPSSRRRCPGDPVSGGIHHPPEA